MFTKLGALCAFLSVVAGSAAQAQVTVQTADSTAPAAYRGEWRTDLDRCGGAPDGTSLVIEESRVRLTESEGSLIAAVPRGPSDVILLAQMSDGKKSWNSALYLNLSADGASLTDVKNGITRHRCPEKP